MKITYFRIENFRNITFAECRNPPDFLVICGGNGCGKSAVLNAIMTAKEKAAPYGEFKMDPQCVSADAKKSFVEIELSFSEGEQCWYKDRYQEECPTHDTIKIEILSGGEAKTTKGSNPTRRLLSVYSRLIENSPGFFDYIDAYRHPSKKDLSSWNPEILSEERMKKNLGATGSSKFLYTKEFLASLKMRYLQELESSIHEGWTSPPDYLKDIREFFNSFFAPMEFLEVRIDRSPFEFIIKTPKGYIDIDDLSSGEKEVLNTYVRFHQLKPRNAVILFDEVDAHLHPELQRRYLEVLRALGKENQLWLTTHSPEMMIAAGAESLYTVLKKQPETNPNKNQFVKVSDNDELHFALSDIMGNKGLVSINQKIIFIEGEEASADRKIYESFYPPEKHNVSFVPCGDSTIVRGAASKINKLLSSHPGYQSFYSIVDGDIERPEQDCVQERLFRLPVYHVENFLLNKDIIYEIIQELLMDKNPYSSSDDFWSNLRELIFADNHLSPFTRAIFDAEVSKLAKQAWDNVYQGQNPEVNLISFEHAKEKATKLLQSYMDDGTWVQRCKGRELIKTLCAQCGFKYEHFRNLVLNRIIEPPKELNDIMKKILED